ncbi:hypothetical protein, partial [Phreatobacter oligotrophus]|uniref:hypothetical protein n=1 Tax=Phreatobacter oligotrophus TaxID=1122261 RepID=UPI001B86503C
MIWSSVNRLFFISVSFRRSPVQTEGFDGGNVIGWLTPRAYASALCGDVGRHAAQADSYARRPLATHLNEGSDQPRTLAPAG